MAAPTFPPDRAAFRLALAEMALKAKATLPECAGRIDSAVALVLAGDVELCSDGAALVGSQADPTQTYRVRASQCACKDFVRAPGEFCKHRLAVGLYRRALELVASVPPSPPVETEPPLGPLPEAPASVNVHMQIAGRQVQLTLRDSDETRLLARLQAVLAQYPVAEPPGRPEGWCGLHNVQMRLNHGKDGKPDWYSHKAADGQWCKGR